MGGVKEQAGVLKQRQNKPLPAPRCFGDELRFPSPWGMRRLVEADLSSIEEAVFVLCHTGDLVSDVHPGLTKSVISAILSALQATEGLSHSELLHCGPSQHGGDGWVWNLRQNCSEHHRTSVAMIHFCLVHTAYHLHCWLPRSHRLRL